MTSDFRKPLRAITGSQKSDVRSQMSEVLKPWKSEVLIPLKKGKSHAAKEERQKQPRP